MHHKLIKMITEENGVPFIQRKKRKLGPYMCVPFGKILKGIIVPNTVTKTLHTQKNFTPDLIHFTIEEYPYYASIENQVKTLKSFNRPVILVDDLLHKGYRMRSLNPVLNENGVEVRKLMGEAARLLGIQRAEDREKCAVGIAEMYGVTAVVKGPGTITASPDGRVRMVQLRR